MAFPLLLMPVVPEALADQSSVPISPLAIDQSVISSLPQVDGQSADIVKHLDLTHDFYTKGQWTFVAATLPGSHSDGSSEGPIKGGPLARCFVHDLHPRCTYETPSDAFGWFSTPIELYSVEVVFAGAGNTRPLLQIRMGSASGGDGGHSIFTELFTFDRRLAEFKSVFSNSTGSNNNQGTRFMEEGPLRGDVIVDEPAPVCCYQIEVFRPAPSGRYVSILRYRGHTGYGDGNPLSVSDSEMPEILRRLGLWHPGDPLPVPSNGCTPVLRHREEWCQ